MINPSDHRRIPVVDERLRSAIELAGHVRVFADIGADHGRLSAVMLMENRADYAIVADISEAALSKARTRIAHLHLNDRTSFAVSDGLDALDIRPDLLPDAVFILGMGGETVSGILHRGRSKLRGASLILSAQTEIPLLRRSISDIGYHIRNEIIAKASGRHYVIMRATPVLADDAPYTDEEYLLGPVLLQELPDNWQPMLTRHHRLLTGAVKAMRASRLEKDSARLRQSERELGYVESALERMKAKEQP